MKIGSILGSLLIVTLFVFAVWAIGEAVGFSMALGPMLIGSLVLTLLLNLLLAGARGYKRRPA